MIIIIYTLNSRDNVLTVLNSERYILERATVIKKKVTKKKTKHKVEKIIASMFSYDVTKDPCETSEINIK